MPNALEELFPHDANGLQGYIAAGLSPRSDQDDEEDGDEFWAPVEEGGKDKLRAEKVKVGTMTESVYVCFASL
jgi:hypothetical protein